MRIGRRRLLRHVALGRWLRLGHGDLVLGGRLQLQRAVLICGRRLVVRRSRLLQALLGFDVPEWHHTVLLVNSKGSRLAKRDKAFTLRAMREAGTDPEEIWAMSIHQIARQAATDEI